MRIWMRFVKKQTRYTTSVLRLFRNGETWKESSRFGPKDIPLLRLLLNEAHLWILQNRECRLRVKEQKKREGKLRRTNTPRANDR